MRKLFVSTIAASILILGAACGKAPITTQQTTAATPGVPPSGVAVANADLKDGRITTPTFTLPPTPTPPSVDALSTIDQASASEHLQQMRTALGGQDFFMPAPLAFHAQRTSAQALAAAKSKGVYPNAEKAAKAPPETFFALFSGGGGTIDPATQAVTPKYVNLPVWVIVYHGVPDYGSGSSTAGSGSSTAGNALSGAASQPEAAGASVVGAPEIHDITFIVNDATGEALMAISE